ncbi:MAG: glycosyltransferase family protein [Deltaproteobacteria bacterium]|nr:glycosyltransferase family protein [Deltaproteobacteria bacterium]
MSDSKPILAILQARTSSTRLPGKVLRPILNRPMLLWQLERIKRARSLDRIIVATSLDSSDTPLVSLCRDAAVDCFRGSLDDVLDRFYEAARTCAPANIVRLTGDNPLIDPEIIDQVVDFHLAGEYDYSSNALDPTFPDGLDVEVMLFSVLEQTWMEARRPSQREHVTPFIYQQRERFRCGSYKNNQDLSAWRWTVDEPEDLEFVRRVYDKLHYSRPDFNMSDILGLLAEQPDLQTINQGRQRNAGYLKSLDAENPGHDRPTDHQPGSAPENQI